MRKLLKDLRKGGQLTFEELAAATALFRPGPLDSGMTEEYVKAKQGISPPHYGHAAGEEVTKNTFGVMVYQEQLMAIMRRLAGFSMAKADAARKAIGKKEKEKLMELKDDFIIGAQAGFFEVTLEDGTVKRMHGSEMVNVEGAQIPLSQAVSEDLEFQA